MARSGPLAERAPTHPSREPACIGPRSHTRKNLVEPHLLCELAKLTGREKVYTEMYVSSDTAGHFSGRLIIVRNVEVGIRCGERREGTFECYKIAGSRPAICREDREPRRGSEDRPKDAEGR